MVWPWRWPPCALGERRRDRTMESKKWKVLRAAALAASLLPAAALLPAVLHVTLLDSLRTLWAAANIAFTLAGLLLSAVCLGRKEGRGPAAVAALVLSALWLLLMAGILALALAVNALG